MVTGKPSQMAFLKAILAHRGFLTEIPRIPLGASIQGAW